MKTRSILVAAWIAVVLASTARAVRVMTPDADQVTAGSPREATNEYGREPKLLIALT